MELLELWNPFQPQQVFESAMDLTVFNSITVSIYTKQTKEYVQITIEAKLTYSDKELLLCHFNNSIWK